MFTTECFINKPPYYLYWMNSKVIELDEVYAIAD